MMQGGGMSMMWLGWLIPLLLVVALVWSVGKFRTSRPSRNPGAPQASDPRGILEYRFANGEIDEAEFRARMNTLNEPRS